MRSMSQQQGEFSTSPPLVNTKSLVVSVESHGCICSLCDEIISAIRVEIPPRNIGKWLTWDDERHLLTVFSHFNLLLIRVMPSLLGLHLGRYDPAASKPSRGWCNDVPYDDSEAEAEWEEYIRRHGSIESNQFDDIDSVGSFKIEEASEEAIEDEIEQAQLEERASLESRTTKYELESPAPRFFNFPVRVSTELVPVETVKMNDISQEEVAKVAKDNNDYETEQDAIAAKYLTPEQLAEEDSDDDVVFDLTPETCPGPSPPRELPQKIPLRIFVATWNMAAKDPFAHRRRGQYIGDDLAAEALRELLPLGYDIYVIGTQEKVTKHLNEAVLARLQQQSTGGKYQRLVATTKQSRTHDECEHLRHLRTYESSDFGSSAGLTSFCGSEAACNMCSPHAASAYSATSPRGRFSYDVPTTRNSMPQAETVDNDACCSWWKKGGEEKEIRGHGDHALIRRKSTGLSVYHVSHLHDRIQVVAAGSHKFTGSKGGIAVTVRIAGDPQTLTFVNCHLEANRIERRRRQLDKLTRELPRALGFTKDEATLATCSDHVIWMGDFNYRIKDLAGNEVIGLLSAGRLQELHDHYDSMADDLENVPGLKTFREPAKWPTFYPTYKKIKCRSKLPLSGSTTGTGQDTRWAQHVYQTEYREPFYKGGRVRERVPGWCDRILFCSRPDSGWTENLDVEQAACSDASRGRSSFSSEAVRDNYRALNDDLRGSDHSPVSCTFLWSVQR